MTILFAGNDLTQIGGTTLTTTAGRFDPDYVSEANAMADNTAYALDFGAPAGNEVWLHMDVRLNLTGTAQDGYGFTANDVNGNLVCRMHISDGRWAAGNNNNGATTFTGTDVAVGTTLRTWDIRIFNDGITNAVDFYLDGAIVSSASNPASGRGVARSFDMGGVDHGGYNVSQIIVSDTSMVGRKLGIIKPNAVGADSAWTGDFNQLGDDDITSVAFTNTIGARVSSVPSAWAGITTGTIENVVPVGIGLSTGSGPQTIAHYLKIGGTDYDGALQAQSPTPDFFVEEFALNPATSLPWTFADLTTIELGLLSGT